MLALPLKADTKLMQINAFMNILFPFEPVRFQLFRFSCSLLQMLLSLPRTSYYLLSSWNVQGSVLVTFIRYLNQSSQQLWKLDIAADKELASRTPKQKNHYSSKQYSLFHGQSLDIQLNCRLISIRFNF